jgi:hypothetical protein
LQATWRGLIRLILGAEGRPTDADTARVYQGTELGRPTSNNCVLELLPLPSRSIGDWIYAEHSALPVLRDRQTYLEELAPKRVSHLKARIREHKPRAVIFYSRNYRPWWEQIAGTTFDAAVPPGLQAIVTSDTVFVMTMHPAYRGVTTDYFVNVGKAIASFEVRPFESPRVEP